MNHFDDVIKFVDCITSMRRELSSFVSFNLSNIPHHHYLKNKLTNKNKIINIYFFETSFDKLKHSKKLKIIKIH